MVPKGNPIVVSLGRSFIFKQFICNVFAAVLKIPFPTTNEQSCCAVLD
jgi:hypothetical protein